MSTTLTPLLDLLRTAASEHGEVVFRVLSSSDEHAATGVVDPGQGRPIIWLPAPDRDTTRPDHLLVSALHQLAVVDLEPRLAESGERFVIDATARTLAAIGGAQ